MLRFATKLAPEKKKIATAYQAGFKNAEIWLGAAILDDPDAVIESAFHVPMDYGMHFPNKGPLTETQLRNAVQLYRRLGCRAMVIHPPMIKLHGDQLLEMAPDIRLAVENGKLGEKEFWRWAEENTWLNLDVEHVWKLTVANASLKKLVKTIRKFLDRYRDKLIHVHLPGYLPGGPEHQPAYFNPEFVTAIWSLLEECDFNGLVVSELSEKFQTLEHLRRDIVLFDHYSRQRTKQSVTA